MACVLDPDLPLVEASKRGDTCAFEELVKRYDRRLLRIALNVTHNRDDAEDAVQDAFLKAYRNLDKFRADAKFSTWLFRIAVNESLMKLRKQRGAQEHTVNIESESDHDLRPAESNLADWSPDPEALYGASEFRQILTMSLQKLSPALRVVFVLRDIEEHSILETSDFLNISENAVKSRLSRARRELREELSKYFKKPE
ncbi:MAG TPA: sigma-70 family RNA polymerase sigma factor [Terriglobales bacterium]|nr:sigma-70 family RNA polymerase sigma factor [Terriglobales bacterium]